MSIEIALLRKPTQAVEDRIVEWVRSLDPDVDVRRNAAIVFMDALRRQLQDAQGIPAEALRDAAAPDCYCLELGGRWWAKLKPMPVEGRFRRRMEIHLIWIDPTRPKRPEQ